MGGYGKQFTRGGKVKYDLEKTADGWHYFGMDWREDGYTFYCDGKEVMSLNDHVSHVPQFILLTTEIQGYRSDRPKTTWTEEEINDKFMVDYVRVFDEVK